MQMSTKILKDFETFEEFPNGVLEIKSNTNLVYIEKENGTFIAREFFKKVSSDNLNLQYEIKYKNVINNDIILTAKIIKENNKTIINYPKEFLKVYQVTHLNEILNIKGNDSYYLTLEEIINLYSYKQELTGKSKIFK